MRLIKILILIWVGVTIGYVCVDEIKVSIERTQFYMETLF